jgi:hypothetical protein
MDDLVKEVIPLLQYLIPGFLAAWIFYSLTAFKRPDTFGQIVQALIFTFVIQSLVVGLGALLLLTGERFFSVGLWDKKSEALWSAVIAVIAVVLGFLSCHVASNDKLHSLLRRLEITRQNSFPCEWYGAFSSRRGFVILNLIDGKRLFGWPTAWPSEPEKKGNLYLNSLVGLIAKVNCYPAGLGLLPLMFQKFSWSNSQKR